MSSLLPGSADVGYAAVVERLLGHLREGGLITDQTPGGVARMLLETFAREVVLLHEALELAHRSGFVDTAEGPALDQVVALLGLSRARAGRLSGTVLFTRSSPAPEDIVIPAGTRVSGRPVRPERPAPLLEVVEEARILREQRSVSAAVQEIPGEETPGLDGIAPGGLHLMVRPLLGVEGVHNPEAITRVGSDEGDTRLRARARVALRAGELATVEAIEAAARSQGAERVQVREPTAGPPGRVIVRVADLGVLQSPERWAALEAAVHRTKAAGVRVIFEQVRSVAVVPALALRPLNPALGAFESEQLKQAVGRALAVVVAGLGPGVAVSRRKLEGAALALPDVADAELLGSTRLFPVGWQDGEPQAGADDTAARELDDGSGWGMGPLEQALMDLRRWPPALTLVRS